MANTSTPLVCPNCSSEDVSWIVRVRYRCNTCSSAFSCVPLLLTHAPEIYHAACDLLADTSLRGLNPNAYDALLSAIEKAEAQTDVRPL